MHSSDTELLTVQELEARTRRRLMDAGDLLEVRRLGVSRSGRPIELLSLGKGTRSALVVGAPHPNEPLGCVTVEHLLDLLLRDQALRENLGYRWHFIQAIDADGLALNAGWLKGPRTPEHYLCHYFRPAFHRQPEYTFPLVTDGYVFDQQTLENRCWQAALDLSRPDLQVSLHNADYGGAFYMTSRNIPALTTELTRQPAAAGLTLNPIGEPFADMEAYVPGVFTFPDFKGLATAIAAKGGNVKTVWPAGNSSAGYAAERHGTFSLVNEVPLWDDSRLRDQNPSRFTLAEVIGMLQRWNTEAAALLDRYDLPGLASLAGSADAGELLAALEETTHTLQGQNAQLGQLASSPRTAERLRVCDYALNATLLRLVTLRPLALLLRLARMAEGEGANPGASTARADAERHLAGGLAALRAETPLTAVPVATLVELQTRSILTTAKALSR